MSSFPLTVKDLPTCVAFRSKHTGRYLHSVEAAAGSVKFAELSRRAGDHADADDDDVLASPYTRFYLEASKEHEGLLHVRCCHNNKYWVAKQGSSSSGQWIVGVVNERDEQLSKPSCTLFEPFPIKDEDKNLSIRFLHPQQSQTPISEDGMAKEETLEEEALLPIDGTGGGHDDDALPQLKSLRDFSVLDLSQQMELPKYVVFKDDNDAYLSARVIQKHNYLQYAASDIGDPTVINTFFPNYASGNVRIKSNHFNRFWRRSPNWIWADLTSPAFATDNRDTLFRVVQLSDSIVALQNLGNNHFCTRLTADGKNNCLNAQVATITAAARIWMEEAVVSREIYNVEFKLSEARIHDEKVLSISRVESINRTLNASTMSLNTNHEEVETSRWSSTVSLKLGVETTLKAGIPIIAEAKVVISAQFDGNYEWGSSIEKKTSWTVDKQVPVPPMTKVILSAVATQGTVDVPYSYTQKDVLTTGDTRITHMDDGLYTGTNSYNFQYETTEEPIV